MPGFPHHFPQPSESGYIRPVFRFGNDEFTNNGAPVNNDAHACLGFCIDIAGFGTGMDLTVPLGLHTCKSTALTGGSTHALDQHFDFNPDGDHKIKFIVEEDECVPGSTCPAAWELPLEKCVERVGNEVFLKDCEHGNRRQKWFIKQRGFFQGQIRQRGKCLAAVKMEAQTTNCFANFPCAEVDLDDCESSNSFPYTGSGGNLCHQYIGLEVVPCFGDGAAFVDYFPDDDDSEEDLYTFKQRTRWLIGEDPISFPNFCEEVEDPCWAE